MDVNIQQAVEAAISLLEGSEHEVSDLELYGASPLSEYCRGMSELLARMWPLPGVDTGDRALEFFHACRKVVLERWAFSENYLNHPSHR